MNFNIDIDTGGTFTDGFFTSNGRYERVKVDTTPHDLTVCFFNCIEEGAKRFGLTTEEMLQQTKVVRFSTTIGTNSLIQRTGPKLGFLATKGHERTLYQIQKGANPVFDSILTREIVIGLDEKIDHLGHEEKALDPAEVKVAVKSLLELGARMIVVSLANAHLNPIHEQQIKKAIEEDYPKHYLGAVPVFLASQLSHSPSDEFRTNTALVNAYLHRDMVKYLYKADDGVRAKGAKRPLLISHATGGAARVAKTKAIDTYNSGPVGGLLGSLYLGREFYNLQNIITFDVGGTSTDIGIIHQGRYAYNLQPQIEGITVTTPLIEVKSIGIAGGSITRVANGKLSVGPDSAGAMPGPVCYDLGQMEPTATDACLVLGYIDPDYFLGGKRILNSSSATAAVEEFLADPLGIHVAEAALRVKEQVESVTADTIERMLLAKGCRAEDFALFSFGGAGGLFCSGVADRLGIKDVYTFPFSSVFSAFGSSTLDVMHSYDWLLELSLAEPDQDKWTLFNETVEQLKQRLLRDMRGEGFGASEIEFSLELETYDDDTKETVVLPSPVLTINSQEDILNLCRTYAVAAGKPAAKVCTVRVIHLKATAKTPHFRLEESPLASDDSNTALKRTKGIYWSEGLVETRIYERNLLKPGIVLKGPAVIEAEDSTYVIPAGRIYMIDHFGNGLITKEEG